MLSKKVVFQSPSSSSSNANHNVLQDISNNITMVANRKVTKQIYKSFLIWRANYALKRGIFKDLLWGDFSL